MVTNIFTRKGILMMLPATLTLACSLSACSDKEYTTDMPQSKIISEITLDVNPELPLEIGADSTIVFHVFPENADHKQLLWHSSNDDIATVDQNGRITAKSVGKAIISVTPEYGFGNDNTAKSIAVTVIQQVTKVTLVEFLNTEHQLYVADRLKLETKLYPVDHTYSHLLWSSSNPAVATVDADGTVTGVAPGEVDITAATHDKGNAKGVYHLTVKESVAATAVAFIAPTEPLPYMQSFTLDYTTEPADATRATITWSSEDESIMRVSDTGVVTPVGFGTTKITATCANGNTASIELTCPNGLYLWNAANQFENWKINSSLGKMKLTGDALECTVTDDANARIYLQRAYSNSQNLMSFDFAKYPILAVRADITAKGATWAINLANIGNTVNISKNCTKEDLGDGTMMLYYDAAAEASKADDTGMTPIRAFMFKITKSPVTTFNIYEIGTFSSVEDAREYFTK